VSFFSNFCSIFEIFSFYLSATIRFIFFPSLFFDAKLLNASHYSFTGGLFDGASEESEMVFKYAVSSLNNPRDRSSLQLKPSEFKFSQFFTLCLFGNLFKNFQHRRKLCTEMSLLQRKQCAK
jgi:hypothetical protein